MKLADLRKQLRHKKRSPVDELDEFLMEKGVMAHPLPDPEPVGPIKGRTADVAIIDDPLVDDERKKRRADFRTEVLGEWVDAPKGEDLPPTLGAMLADGTVTWANAAPNRIAGQLVYDRKADDLCEVKARGDEREAVALVWHGERDDNGQQKLKAVPLDQLFVVKTASCRNCAGETRWAGRRGIAMKCKQCQGLGRVPTREALAPFKRRDEKKRVLEALAAGTFDLDSYHAVRPQIENALADLLGAGLIDFVDGKYVINSKGREELE